MSAPKTMKVTALSTWPPVSTRYGRLGAVRPVTDAEDEPADERGDEPAPAERSRDPVRERGCRKRDHLQPVLGHEPPPLDEAEDDRAERAGGDAADDPPADLLDHEPHGVRAVIAWSSASASRAR